MKHFRKEWN